MEMIDSAEPLVGGERRNGGELLVSFEVVDVVDPDLLQSCGHEGRSGGPASESGAETVVGAKPKEGERWREAAEERSRIEVAVEGESGDRQSGEVGAEREEFCDPRHVVGVGCEDAESRTDDSIHFRPSLP